MIMEHLAAKRSEPVLVLHPTGASAANMTRIYPDSIVRSKRSTPLHARPAWLAWARLSNRIEDSTGKYAKYECREFHLPEIILSRGGRGNRASSAPICAKCSVEA